MMNGKRKWSTWLAVSLASTMLSLPGCGNRVKDAVRAGAFDFFFGVSSTSGSSSFADLMAGWLGGLGEDTPES